MVKLYKSSVIKQEPYLHTPQWKSFNEILKHSLRGGSRAFLLAYLIKGGVGTAIKLLFALKKRTSIKAILEPLFFSKDTLRFASAFGSFSLFWRLINNSLRYYRNKHDRWNGFIAGSLASFSILFENKDQRLAISQQLFIRAMQSSYNSLKGRGILSLPNGDAFLFMFACSSIMYAYIMTPTTIPKEYYIWIRKMGQMPESLLNINRIHVRNLETSILSPNFEQMQQLIISHGGNQKSFIHATSVLSPNGSMPIIPCSILHPKEISCTRYNLMLFYKAFLSILPVYAALNLVPMLVLKGKQFIEMPLTSLKRALKMTVRSSVFIASYVLMFMSCICLGRKLVRLSAKNHGSFLSNLIGCEDNKLLYYLFGIICSSSIFLENKSRRTELALYVLPKGLTSLYLVLLNRGYKIRVPGFDLILNSLGLGILMSFYQHEPKVISSLLYSVMVRVIGKN